MSRQRTEQKRYNLGGKKTFDSQVLRAKFSREDEVLLTQLFMGHCQLVGDFRMRLMKGTWDESVHHIFNACHSASIRDAKIVLRC
jgi:hypothetical protein